MKVLLLIHGMDLGGSESMVAALARYLLARGDAVEIGCLGVLGRLGAEVRAAGMPIVVHARRHGPDATLPLRLAQRIRAEQFDVVHAHQRTALFYGLLAGLLHYAPLVYTEHGPAVGTPIRWRQRVFNRALGWRARRVTAVSQHLARQLVECEGLRSAKVEVIHNAVDVERFAGGARGGRDAARVQLGLPASAAIIGSVGRLDAVKNYALLMRAVRLLPEHWLVLVGDGPEQEALTALAQQLGITARVRFLGMRRDVGHVLPAFDVFCLSSVSEGIPLSMLEAMAARVPVVATRAGGIPEAVRHEREALLVDGNPADLAAALARVLADAALRRALTDSAFTRVATEFVLDAVCRRYAEVLESARRRP